MSEAIGWIDWIVLAAAVGSAILVGLWTSRRNESPDAFLFGGRNLPWWAILGSIVATETSAVTVLSVTGTGFGPTGMRFLQLAIGLCLGKILVACFLMPRFFDGRMVSAYEILERRFGSRVRRLAGLMFLVARNLGDGLRLSLGAIVLKELMGWDFLSCILLTGVVTIAYTCLGGMRSVVWNDCLQLLIYLAGGVATLLWLVWNWPGGASQWFSQMAGSDKLHAFDFGFQWSEPHLFWSGLIGGTFLVMGTHGADQMMVQRYLSTRSCREASAALVTSGVVIFLQFALFLLIGVTLSIFYAGQSEAPTQGDRVYMHFVVHHFPYNSGLSGLMLAAILAATMSTLSSSLNASASSLLNDFVLPRTRLVPDEKQVLGLSRGMVVGFGVLQMVIGVWASTWRNSVIENSLAISGFVFGILLGMFVLALLVPAAGPRAVLVGGTTALAVLLTVKFLLPRLNIGLAWTWLPVLGTLTTFGVGILASRWQRPTVAACVGLAVLLWPATSATAQLVRRDPESMGYSTEKLRALRPIIEAAIEAGEMPGCVVCLGGKGGIVWLEACGRRQVQPHPEPMTVDTVFDLASLTKPIATATAIMQLVERGKLLLDDRVASHWPEFGAKGKEAVRVRDLLLHRSGLMADNPLADYAEGPAESLRRIAALPLSQPLGEAFVYSDVNFIVLGELVRRISGRPLAEWCQTEIFDPLQMIDTGFLPSDELKLRSAPTEQQDGKWLRGTVHDPRAAALGGVAGHAGLFSTASDLARFAEALLPIDNTAQIEGSAAHRLLAPVSVEAMTRGVPVGPALRGLGWDRRSSYSIHKGDLLSDSAFGHGGFTGTALWIDPEQDLYFIFLSNRLHPDGKGLVNPLIGRLLNMAVSGREKIQPVRPRHPVLTGIDVLERDGFRQLAGKRIGLITNQTGRSRAGRPTVELLQQAENVRLVALFSPEHGFFGTEDREGIEDKTDEQTGLPVYSLYGQTRRPTPAMLDEIDTLVFDIQDVGTRFYTYLSTMGEAMEAAAEQGRQFVVLDRPNPINGVAVEGPLSDPGQESFTAWHPLPVRHGMTVGELARMIRSEKKLNLDLRVIACEGWSREMWWDETGLEWVNPSPNMRSPAQSLLYPGIGLLETTNLSVGRGTDRPFEIVGAPWIKHLEWADQISARKIPGLAVVPVTFVPTGNRFVGETCFGLQLFVTDRARFEPVAAGLAMAHLLRKLHPDAWECDGYRRLLANEAAFLEVRDGPSGAAVIPVNKADREQFLLRRQPFLLYR